MEETKVRVIIRRNGEGTCQMGIPGGTCLGAKAYIVAIDLPGGFTVTTRACESCALALSKAAGVQVKDIWSELPQGMQALVKQVRRRYL